MNIEEDAFPADATYPEAQIGKMGKMAMKILSLKDEEFYEGMGKYFVQLAKDVGYENTLLALGSYKYRGNRLSMAFILPEIMKCRVNI